MKKTLLLSLVAGLVSATQLQAVDLYITGSTAFRANVYNACTKLFVGGTPAIAYGPSSIGGSGSANSKNPVWCMSGTAATTITNLSSGRLVIHGEFTGSIQGIKSVETKETISFCDTNGVAITNTPTIAFSDCATLSTPFPANSPYSEEQVAVQPFCMVKSLSVNTAMTNITNVSFEQLRYIISLGNTPLSAWTGKASDLNTPIYLINRTKDSGTRRTTYANCQYGYGQSAVIYIYDVTNNVFYSTTSSSPAPAGGGGFGVIGSTGAGVNGDNLAYGPGYIGGGDISSELGKNNAANLAISYLSIADAQNISQPSTAVTASNWTQVVSLDGQWPTAAGPGISGNGSTNDFSPVINGSYGLWGYEVVVYPTTDPSSISADQNLTANALGNQSAPGTILGVLDSQSIPGAPILGSLENEIVTSNPNTAIPLNVMNSGRASVGGTIAP